MGKMDDCTGKYPQVLRDRQTGKKTLQQPPRPPPFFKSVKIETIHLVPECCRFLLLPFPLGGLLCLSWFSLCSQAASLTRWVPVLPRRPRFSPEPIRGNVAPLALWSQWGVWLEKLKGMQESGGAERHIQSTSCFQTSLQNLFCTIVEDIAVLVLQFTTLVLFMPSGPPVCYCRTHVAVCGHGAARSLCPPAWNHHAKWTQKAW